MAYKFSTPINFTGSKFNTYTEEVHIKNGIATCKTCTAKQILLANGFIELPDSVPPKAPIVYTPDSMVEIIQKIEENKSNNRVIIKPSYEIEIIEPKM